MTPADREAHRRKQLKKRANEKRYHATARGKATNAFKSLRGRARRAGREVEIALDDLIRLHGEPCWYCDSEPDTRSSIDRVENHLGYTHDNLVPACNFCNSKKRTDSLEEITAKRAGCEAEVGAWRNLERGIERHRACLSTL